MRQFGHFIYQASHTFFTKVLVMLAAIITGILIARFLGPTGKGIIAILGVPPALVCAFGELGIRQATAFLVAKKKYDSKDIQASMLALYCITGTISLSAVLIAYWILGTFQYGLILNLMFAFATPVILFRRYANGLLLGRQLMTRINYIELLDKGGILLGVLVLVGWFGCGLLGVGIAYFMGPAIAVPLLLFWISHFASLKPRLVSPIPGEILRKGLSFALSLFIIMLNCRVGILILGKLRDPGQAGIYSVGAAISELLWQIPLSIGVVLFARSMSWTSQKAERKLEYVFLLLRVMLPVIIITAGGLFLISYYMIPVFYGEEFVESFKVLGLLLPGTVPLALFIFMHFYAAGQGYPLMALYGFIPGLIINILLNIYLIPRYGYLGAAVSSTFSYSVSVMIYFHFFRQRYGGTLRDIVILKKSDIKLFLKDLF